MYISLVESLREPHTIWIDNFSKIWPRTMPNLDKGAWADCLWTGVAIHAYSGSFPLTMNILRDAHGEGIPAMPNNLFTLTPKLIKLWTSYCADIDYCTQSMVSAWKVNSVPLKPQAANMPAGPHQDAINSDVNTLNRLHPKELIPLNIGSNKGLATILRTHYENNNQHTEETRQAPRPCPKYSAFGVDIDIFRRMLLV
jgi:hypothetical protein